MRILVNIPKRSNNKFIILSLYVDKILRLETIMSISKLLRNIYQFLRLKK